MASQIDTVKESFEGSGINKSDWESVGKYSQAINANQYRVLTAKLNEKEGLIKIEFTDKETSPMHMATSYCIKITDLAPLEMPADWDTTTADQEAITRVYDSPLDDGQGRKEVIKGWTFVMNRIKNTFYCSAKEGA